MVHGIVQGRRIIGGLDVSNQTSDVLGRGRLEGGMTGLGNDAVYIIHDKQHHRVCFKTKDAVDFLQVHISRGFRGGGGKLAVGRAHPAHT